MKATRGIIPIAFLAGSLVLVSLDTAVSHSQTLGTPSKVYLDFRTLVKSAKYSEAFALFDESARAEIRTVAVVIFGMMGIPTARVNSMSEFEVFRMFMSAQTPHEFEIISEKVDGSTALVRGRVKQGDVTQPIEITLSKASGRWLIHSTGVAFGGDTTRER